MRVHATAGRWFTDWSDFISLQLLFLPCWFWMFLPSPSPFCIHVHLLITVERAWRGGVIDCCALFTRLTELNKTVSYSWHLAFSSVRVECVLESVCTSWERTRTYKCLTPPTPPSWNQTDKHAREIMLSCMIWKMVSKGKQTTIRENHIYMGLTMLNHQRRSRSTVEVDVSQYGS